MVIMIIQLINLFVISRGTSSTIISIIVVTLTVCMVKVSILMWDKLVIRLVLVMGCQCCVTIMDWVPHSMFFLLFVIKLYSHL